MTLWILIALAATALFLWLAGARTLAHVSYGLAFVPFITLDASSGGLVDVTQFGAGNTLFKLAARAGATALLALVLWRHRAAVLERCVRPAALPVLGLTLWALLGLHRTPVPWVPFFRLGELVVFFLTGVVLYITTTRTASLRAALTWHCLALAPTLVIAVVLALANPELAFHTSSDGVQRMGHKFMNANVLGFAAVVVLLWSSYELAAERAYAVVRRVVPWLCLGLAGYVLFHARSRTATVTAAFGLVVLHFPYWPSDSRRLLRFGLGCAVVLALALTRLDAVWDYFLRGESAADVATGTGRTELWRALLLEQVPQAPWLGAGYMMLSAEGGFTHAGHFWNNAHNTYLFALVSTGVPGLACVLTLILWPLLAAGRATLRAARGEREAWALALALAVVVALTSVPEFGIVGYPNVTMLLHYGLYTLVIAAATRAAASASERRQALCSSPVGVGLHP